MITYLENEHLLVAVESLGAELKRIYNKDNEQEVLWNADANYWGKTSPVLFPIVGALKDNLYTYKGETYSLPRHGFARERNFELETQSSEELTFVLRDDESSRKVFPFCFEFRISYTLKDNSLACKYAVLNPAEEVLLFSVGGHPAFAVQTTDNKAYSDYYLEFNKDSELAVYPLENNFIAKEPVGLPLSDENQLTLSHSLFYNDALVFKSLKSNEIKLRNTKDSLGIDFHFEGFPYFGIWAAKDADFVCLEPWCGIADGIQHNQELTEKEGIVVLGAQETFEKKWEVKVIS